ncbi:MAG: OsmC family protein [Bacteroidetes bacterium]|nr:OsmC family protein [Bacteroidota bacterium]
MKIKVTRIDDGFHFVAENETGNTLSMDAGSELGGSNTGMRPIELMPAALAGCSAFDIVSILKKQRQHIKDFQVEVNAERQTGKMANLITAFNIVYTLRGNIDKEKLEKAIELSMKKYCSVAKMLEKTAKITYSYVLYPK